MQRPRKAEAKTQRETEKRRLREKSERQIQSSAVLTSRSHSSF